MTLPTLPTSIPEILHPPVKEYFELVERGLPGMLSGWYVVGSIALGGFNPQWSDIDFVAVLSRPMQAGDPEHLKRIHGEIAGRYPPWKMEGIYLKPGDLGRLDGSVLPYPVVHDGKVELSTTFERNPVTWWILKNRGITVSGPDAAGLPFEVDWAGLVRWMHTNLNTYWASWTHRPDGLLALLSDYGVQWSVLGVLRQYYTFQEHSIVSKTEAGEYALSRLPKRWHRLVQEALAIRCGGGKSLYGWRILRAVDAVRFLRTIIETCNRQLARQIH